MRTALWLVAALAAQGCKKDPPVAGPGPVSTAEQDTLWKLAPSGATFGLVASGRSLAMAEGAWAAIRSFAATAPELGRMVRWLDRMALGATTVADFGFARDRGLAIFAIGERDGVVIVPIVDRGKFFARIGAEGDSDAQGRLTCKAVGAYHACAKTAALLEQLGKGDLRARLDTAGARGDVEVAGGIPGGPSGALVAQLARGEVVLRGVVDGLPPTITKALSGHARPRVDDTTSGFAVVDVRPLLADADALSPIVAGVARTISGPITMVATAGTFDLDLRVPLSDPQPLQQLIPMICQPTSTAESRMEGDRCVIRAKGFDKPFAVRVEGSELRFSRLEPEKGKRLAMSPVGDEIARGEWAIASHGRGTVLASTIKLAELERHMPPWAPTLVRALAMVNEIGFAVRVDGSSVRFLASLRTGWADPDDVVRKVLAVPPDAYFSGKAADLARPIAGASPRSHFAADFEAGQGGMIAVVAPVGILAAVAIPLALDSLKKPRKSEAVVQLNKIRAKAKEEWAVNAALPKQAAPLTPATPCCDQDFAGLRKCAVDASAWSTPAWQSLDFAMDEAHYYRYSYTPTANGFVATAVGDLDCDTTTIEYKLIGEVVNGELDVRLEEPPPNTD